MLLCRIRKRKLLCPRQSCPHIFCGRCADKMLEEYGEDVFINGCPVCNELCCCSNKTIMCHRQNHCYRKCPATKGKNGLKLENNNTNNNNGTENNNNNNNSSNNNNSESEFNHISAPALEILAQVVSDPFQTGEVYFPPSSLSTITVIGSSTSQLPSQLQSQLQSTSQSQSSPTSNTLNQFQSKPEISNKRKNSFTSSPTNMNLNNAAATTSLSLSSAMYDSIQQHKSPRLEGLDRNKMFLLPPPPDTTGLLTPSPSNLNSIPSLYSTILPTSTNFNINNIINPNSISTSSSSSSTSPSSTTSVSNSNTNTNNSTTTSSTSSNSLPSPSASSSSLTSVSSSASSSSNLNTTSTLFNVPYTPGLQSSLTNNNHGTNIMMNNTNISKDNKLTTDKPSAKYSTDAASISTTYAISSLSALTAAAGNYDQYTHNSNNNNNNHGISHNNINNINNIHNINNINNLNKSRNQFTHSKIDTYGSLAPSSVTSSHIPITKVSNQTLSSSLLRPLSNSSTGLLSSYDYSRSKSIDNDIFQSSLKSLGAHHHHHPPPHHHPHHMLSSKNPVQHYQTLQPLPSLPPPPPILSIPSITTQMSTASSSPVASSSPSTTTASSSAALSSPSSSFINQPQYLSSNVAFSDAPYDPYATPSILLSSLSRPIQPNNVVIGLPPKSDSLSQKFSSSSDS